MPHQVGLRIAVQKQHRRPAAPDPGMNHAAVGVQLVCRKALEHHRDPTGAAGGSAARFPGASPARTPSPPRRGQSDENLPRTQAPPDSGREERRGNPTGRHERRELRRKARAATLAALRRLGGQGPARRSRARAVEVGGFTPRELSAVGVERSGGRGVRRRRSAALLGAERPQARRSGREPAARDVEADRGGACGSTSSTDAVRRLPEDARVGADAHSPRSSEPSTRCALDLSHTDGLEVQHRTNDRLGAERPATWSSCAVRAWSSTRMDECSAAPRTGSIPPPVPQSVPQPVIPITARHGRRKPRLLRRLLAS